MRVLLAAIAGAVAMFIWMSVAHMATPLATTGIKQLPNEGQVISAIQNSAAGKHGLYIYPWMDPKDPNGMKKLDEKLKTSPHGFIIYNPPGAAGMSPGMLGAEFGKEFVLSLIAAFLVSQMISGGYLARVGFVSLVGLAGALTTNPSYMIWYGFPKSYTLGYAFIDFVGFVVAGLAIAAIVKPKSS